jgi:hypothetical protein
MSARKSAASTVTPPFQLVTTPAGDSRRKSASSGGTGRLRDERRRDAVRLLASFRALRRDQLETLLFMTQDLRAESRRVLTHRIVTDLRQRGLLEAVTIAGPLERAQRGYVLTVDGRRVYAAMDPAYPLGRSRAPSTLLLAHATMLADIAVALQVAAREADVALAWESDWQAVTRLGSAMAIPDALATFEHDGRRVRAFMEADRSTEHDEAFATKVRRYVQLYLADEWRTAISSWPLILTVTLSDVRARAIARVCQRVAIAQGGSRIARAFRTTSLDALRRESAFASIWYLGSTAERIGILEHDVTGGPSVAKSTP